MHQPHPCPEFDPLPSAHAVSLNDSCLIDGPVNRIYREKMHHKNACVVCDEIDGLLVIFGVAGCPNICLGYRMFDDSCDS